MVKSEKGFDHIMTSKESKILFIFMLLSYTIPLFSEEKLELIHADVVKGVSTEKGNAIIANGNVEFRQQTLNMFCERVTWYKEKHETIFEDNVKFIDESKTLTADKIFYNDSTHVMRAVGHVVVVDSLQKLVAEKAIYLEQEEKITADHNVEITDNENAVILTGQHAEYWRNDEYALVTGDPVLIKKDSTGNEEIRVIGLKMELFEGGEHAIVTDSVTITHESGVSKCNKAEFFKGDNRILLLEKPVVWQKQDQLSGNEIELFFKQKELTKVIITTDALVQSPVDTTIENSRMNKLLGDKVTLLIEESVLKQVLVEGKATTFYHIVEEGEYKGLNKVIGDKILMHLDEGKIDNITIESDPESSAGIYYPPGFANKVNY